MRFSFSWSVLTCVIVAFIPFAHAVSPYSFLSASCFLSHAFPPSFFLFFSFLSLRLTCVVVVVWLLPRCLLFFICLLFPFFLNFSVFFPVIHPSSSLESALFPSLCGRCFLFSFPSLLLQQRVDKCVRLLCICCVCSK